MAAGAAKRDAFDILLRARRFADDDDFRRRNARNAAEQHATAAVGFLERGGAGLDRHAARDLAHRLEQRQGAARTGHGFIGNRGDAGLDQIGGLLRIGR